MTSTLVARHREKYALASAVLVIAAVGCGGPEPQTPTTVAANRAGPAPAPKPVADAAVDAAAPDAGSTIVITDTDRCGFIIDTVYFPRDSSSLGSRQAPILEATAAMLRCHHRECSALRIEVAGHASLGDSRPAEISQARAQAVYDDLVARGVPAPILSVNGYGAGSPRDPAQTGAAFAKNQRVEFLVDSNGC